ncbi:ATP-binding cassette domain-containing protein [Pseudonocardia sp. HH130629-09]|uniref:ATP-binding cassette domain-containing protein n=1 Tax=Pseudonocardia sp. HH130629-09 TaxID=1641402 RepID=UPI000760C6D5|nr:ATP-binding cassette domain-containing protein [Pseudonocardia sp. HH130629-09]
MRALSGIDLEVGRGEFVSLVGRSGCGKTTLLRILSGLLAPSAGLVEAGGLPAWAAGRRDDAVFAEFGLVFQEANPPLGVRHATQLLLVGVWQFTVSVVGVSEFILPAPTAVVQALGELLAGDLGPHRRDAAGGPRRVRRRARRGRLRRRGARAHRVAAPRGAARPGRAAGRAQGGVRADLS